MSLYLSSASVQQLTTILNLYPADSLRENWANIKGTKDNICSTVAGKGNVPDISDFVHGAFRLCKQHIYVFRHDAKAEDSLNLAIPDTEIIKETKDGKHVAKTFLIRQEVGLILKDPLAEVQQDFFLPIRIEYLDNFVLVKFVIFERDFHLFFPSREIIVPRKRNNEDGLIHRFVKASHISLSPADLHKGVKQLCDDDDFMDATKI